MLSSCYHSEDTKALGRWYPTPKAWTEVLPRLPSGLLWQGCEMRLKARGARGHFTMSQE